MKLLTKVNFNINTEEANKFCKFDFDPVPEIIEEYLKLSGWVVGIESPVVGIELIQDGQLVREVPLTIDRPLPNQIYATFPGAEQSGFIIDTSLEKINVESVHILIQAVLENFQRIPLATLNVYKDEETIQDLAQTKAELYETREELERLQSQFDEVLAELEQAHLRLHQTEQTQSEKRISTNLEKKIKQETIVSKPKLAHHLINNKLLLSVSPRAGHRTVINLIEALTQQNKSITYERIRDVETVSLLKDVKKIKFVRNPYERAVSSYLICCENPVLKLWHGIGLTEQQSKQLTFENFIKILKKKDISKLNHHLSNQVEIGEGEKFNYDEVRKIENIQQEIQEILQEEEIDVDLAAFTKRGVRQKKQVKGKCYSKPFKQLHRESAQADNTWPDYEFFYNAQLTEAVAQIYETDLYDYPSVANITQLEQEHSQLNQIEKKQSQKAISTFNIENMQEVNHPISKNYKVFGIGLSKTGTASLTLAMEIIGYKTKHYFVDCDVNLAIANHDFVSDMPIQTRYKEYDQKYPGSKFILTVRDKESWLKSCSNHFRDHVRDKNSLRYKYRIEQTGIDGYDEDIFSKTYDQHIEEVKKYFKNREADLLIINICAGDGWDKLCSFLGQDVPSKPFPKANVSKSKQASSVVSQPVPKNIEKKQYIANSPELQKTGINSNEKREKNGSDSGWSGETKDQFNPALYIASNARLIESIGYDLEAARKHYLEEGYQNHWLVDLFDPHSYLSKYKDVSNAFGDDLGGATRHYIVNGYKEGRFWTNDLSVVEAVLQREPEHKGAQKEKFLTTWEMLQNPQVNTEILSKAMTNRIGIGVITYNRLEYLKGCINNIRKYTQSPYYLVIADDGSSDGTVEWCQSEGLVVITGQNRGVCWNKNRALYALKEYTDANCIMLLEDDCWPTEKGWELAWLQTTAIWHHVNYAAPWILKHNPAAIYQQSGEMPTSPYLLKLITGQCTTSSRQALNCVGYLDSRFQGYGYGHSEWTQRFMRCSAFIDSLPVPIGETYPAINTGLTTQKSISYSNEADRQKNAQVLSSLTNEPIYRSPWQKEDEKFLFLQEVSSVQYPLLQQVSRVSSVIWFNTLNSSPQTSTSQIVQTSAKEAQLPTPRMSEAEVTLFTKYLHEQKVVIEFGAGGSTGLAIKTGVKQLYSVESDLEFIKKLQEYTLIQKAVEEGQVQFFHINIGPVGAWGYPRDRSSQENWPKYYSNIWQKVPESADLVFIDGRFRVACALQSLSHINKNAKIIMHDFWDRPSYHDVLKFFDAIESADTLVVLQPKDKIDQNLLSAMIEQYKYIAA